VRGPAAIQVDGSLDDPGWAGVAFTAGSSRSGRRGPRDGDESLNKRRIYMSVNAFMKGVRLWSIGACCLLAPWFAFADTSAACDPQTVEKADRGYTCVVKTRNGPVSWRVEAVSQGTRPLRVVKDLKSGLYVSDDLGKHSHGSATNQKLCNSPEYSNQRGNLASVAWRLPSGYPRKLNGKNGFPNRDSDFVVLEDDGIRQVISGLANKWFVSSSDPGDGFSFGYDGEFGGIDTGCDGNGNVSLRCVGQ